MGGSVTLCGMISSAAVHPTLQDSAVRRSNGASCLRVLPLLIAIPSLRALSVSILKLGPILTLLLRNLSKKIKKLIQNVLKM